MRYLSTHLYKPNVCELLQGNKKIQSAGIYYLKVCMLALSYQSGNRRGDECLLTAVTDLTFQVVAVPDSSNLELKIFDFPIILFLERCLTLQSFVI